MDTPPAVIPTLSLHDALPISRARGHRDRGRVGGRGARRAGVPADAARAGGPRRGGCAGTCRDDPRRGDRKSTRLNSSHGYISYAVLCLKKKIEVSELGVVLAG